MDWTLHHKINLQNWTLCFHQWKRFCLKEEIQCKFVETIQLQSWFRPEEINQKDQESDKDRQQQTADKNLFDKLLDEILEMILMNVTKSHTIDAFYSISPTCKRFQPVIEGKKRWNTTDGSYQFSRKFFSKICQE